MVAVCCRCVLRIKQEMEKKPRPSETNQDNPPTPRPPRAVSTCWQSHVEHMMPGRGHQRWVWERFLLIQFFQTWTVNPERQGACCCWTPAEVVWAATLMLSLFVYMFNEFRSLLWAKASQQAQFFYFFVTASQKREKKQQTSFQQSLLTRKRKIWPSNRPFNGIFMIMLYARLLFLLTFFRIIYIFLFKEAAEKKRPRAKTKAWTWELSWQTLVGGTSSSTRFTGSLVLKRPRTLGWWVYSGTSGWHGPEP